MARRVEAPGPPPKPEEAPAVWGQAVVAARSGERPHVPLVGPEGQQQPLRGVRVEGVWHRQPTPGR